MLLALIFLTASPAVEAKVVTCPYYVDTPGIADEDREHLVEQIDKGVTLAAKDELFAPQPKSDDDDDAVFIKVRRKARQDRYDVWLGNVMYRDVATNEVFAAIEYGFTLTCRVRVYQNLKNAEETLTAEIQRLETEAGSRKNLVERINKLQDKLDRVTVQAEQTNLKHANAELTYLEEDKLIRSGDKAGTALGGVGLGLVAVGTGMSFGSFLYARKWANELINNDNISMERQAELLVRANAGLDGGFSGLAVVGTGTVIALAGLLVGRKARKKRRELHEIYQKRLTIVPAVRQTGSAVIMRVRF